MLQRAASNAYSWWWASHVRTKQSKWLEQSLQDMAEKVQVTIKLIEEDGDSFAKRAEMYYKKRPELINFVQETYRAYRALAERYDHISKELQNANNTIASVFPEQVQFAMEDDDDFDSPRVPKNIIPSQASRNNVPKVPKFPSRDLKSLLTSASKNLQVKKASKASKASNVAKTAPKSGLSKSEAVEQIGKLQKEILALQTVKEFVKSSYESGLTKFREIENQITELQGTVCSLEDEFSVSKVFEDEEARTLMAEAALKSCEEALTQLQGKQEKSTKQAREEFKRVEDSRKKLKSLEHKLLPDQQAEEEKPNDKDGLKKARESVEERQEKEVLREKIKEQFEVGCKESLTVTELAEKINELVSKVIDLETAVSSQTGLIDRLKNETDDLQAQIRTLEDDKATLVDGGTNTVSNNVRGMDEKLGGLENLNQNVENQNNSLRMHFTEARCSLDHLSKKLCSTKPDEEVEVMESLHVEKEEKASVEVKTPLVLKKQENMPNARDGSINSGPLKEVLGEEKNEKILTISVNGRGEKEDQKVSHLQSNIKGDSVSEKREDPKSLEDAKEDEPNWQQMLMNGMDDGEKILLSEYTDILRNYKDLKKKLSDVEQKNQDTQFDTTVQLSELKGAIAKRDEEIQSLRTKLNLLQQNEDLKEENQSIRLVSTEESKINGAMVKEKEEEEEEEEVKLILIDQPKRISTIEEKLRMNIDTLLDENLDFWLRFSTSFHQIQKFKTGFQDLQEEILKIKEKEKSNREGSVKKDIKSELRPIYKHLREIHTELTLWIEQSSGYKEELQRRFSSFCKVQDEITEALKAGAEEEEMLFTSHGAAKFQGEVLNMKQQNKKVRDELQTGLDHVYALQLDIDKALEKLNEEFGFSGPERDSSSRPRVPLQSFIFGSKPKKKSSIFSCMHPRKYNEAKTGLNFSLS